MKARNAFAVNHYSLLQPVFLRHAFCTHILIRAPAVQPSGEALVPRGEVVVHGLARVRFHVQRSLGLYCCSLGFYYCSHCLTASVGRRMPAAAIVPSLVRSDKNPWQAASLLRASCCRMCFRGVQASSFFARARQSAHHRFHQSIRRALRSKQPPTTRVCNAANADTQLHIDRPSGRCVGSWATKSSARRFLARFLARALGSSTATAGLHSPAPFPKDSLALVREVPAAGVRMTDCAS